MKNRPNIKFERTNEGFVGTLATSDTFLITRGASKRVIRKEIQATLKEF